jgi:hypothetical protein
MANVLLFLILCVLLFGASTVLTGLSWFAIFVVGVGVLGSVLILVVQIAAWLLKLPRALASFCRGWAKLLVAPVFAPVENWRSARMPGPEQSSIVVATVSTLWTFVVAVFLWYLAVLPLLFATAYVYEALH